MLDPRLEYSNRLDSHLNTLSAKDLLHKKIGNAKLLAVIAGLLFAYLCFSRNLFPSSWMLIFIAVYLTLALLHELPLLTTTGLIRLQQHRHGRDTVHPHPHVHVGDI